MEISPLVAPVLTSWLDSEPGSDPDRCREMLEAIRIDHNHLTRSQQVDLRRLIEANQEVFALEPSELGTTNIVTYTIDTGDQPPI